jgi:hypothetical protein
MVTHPNAPVTARRRAYRPPRTPRAPPKQLIARSARPMAAWPARELIEDIDLRQAARHTGDPARP